MYGKLQEGDGLFLADTGPGLRLNWRLEDAVVASGIAGGFIGRRELPGAAEAWGFLQVAV